MILKPSEILPDNGAFSAENAIQITWKNNGDSMKAYEIIVEDNSTGNQVYTSGKINAYSGKHTISANTLVNGILYRFKIKVYNGIDEYAISDYKVFSCYSSPSVVIPNDGYIRNQLLTVSAVYNQSQNILLNTYKFILYDEYENILEESEYKYDGLLNHNFTYKLENDGVYKVECVVFTVNGILGSSGKVTLTAQYEAPTVYFQMQTSVPYDKCYVELAWSTVRIIGKTINSPVYIDSNMIDLSNDILTYDDCFELPAKFTLRIWLKKIKIKINLVELIGSNGSIIISYYDNKFHAFRNVKDIKTHIVSQELNVLEDDLVYVCLQQLNGFMNIFCEVI